jgi:hypothetical protein
MGGKGICWQWRTQLTVTNDHRITEETAVAKDSRGADAPLGSMGPKFDGISDIDLLRNLDANPALGAAET